MTLKVNFAACNRFQSYTLRNATRVSFGKFTATWPRLRLTGCNFIVGVLSSQCILTFVSLRFILFSFTIAV